MAQIVAVTDETGKRIGEVEKSEVHRRGLWHRSVLLIVSKDNDGNKILVYKRGNDQSYGLRWDLPGGHHETLDRNIRATAARELAEEVLVTIDGKIRKTKTRNLRLFGKENWLRSAKAQNKELTSVFAVKLPREAHAQVRDDGISGVRDCESEFRNLTELQCEFRENPFCFADGLNRFLGALDEDSHVSNELYSNILGHRKWRITFTALPSDDTDFYFEQEFVGTYANAKDAAQKINHFEYFGDASWNISPRD